MCPVDDHPSAPVEFISDEERAQISQYRLATVVLNRYEQQAEDVATPGESPNTDAKIHGFRSRVAEKVESEG